MIRAIPLFLIACTFGLLFSRLHVPLPWTLGPLLAAILWKSFIKQPVVWPKKIRNICLAVLGYMLGSPFTSESAWQIIDQLPIMLLLTVSTLFLCLFAGYIAGRYTGINLETSLIGSIPGGLSQMSAICEEARGVNVTIVTMMQTIRVVTVVFTVPFLALHGIADHITPAAQMKTYMTFQDLPTLAFFAIVIFALIIFAKKLHLSSPYVLAPILGTAFLVLYGIHAPVLPPFVIALAQICIGMRMGLDVEFSNIPNVKQICYCTLLSILAVIILLLGIAYIYSHLAPISFVTAFLSMAPGGISEMGLTATIANADVPTVVSFQLFRLLFVLLVGVPAIKWCIAKLPRSLSNQR